MKPTGRVLMAFCMLTLVLASGASQAAITASLDRDRVAMGDTLRLTISATENEAISSTDLRPLLADFEILGRSTSSNTSITNGRRSHIKQLLIDITPRREGTLKIPPMRVGQHATNMLLVAVSPSPDSVAGGQTVLFEAEVDRDSVYVQGQIILTLRLQQAVNLESRSITELQLDQAFVKPLEQNSFQRTMDGRPWLVHEVRYAIFPEQSGTLEIPVQTFTARESGSRRGFFDLNSSGRQLRRNTEPLKIQVLPRPETFPSSTWLPARSLTLQESWSTPPEQLRAGESATRTIRIQGEGLQGAQLPPVLLPATQGLKYYPDQPVIKDTETATGLLGSRQDSAALVPTQAGTWTIPEIRIPWWDTESGEVRYATLAGREISVAAADPAATGSAAPLPTPVIDTGNIALTPATGVMGDNLGWKAAAVTSSVGWLLTVAYLFWSRRKASSPTDPVAHNPSEKHAFKQVLAACASDSALHARKAFIDWTAALFPGSNVVSTEQVSAIFADEELHAELEQLNTSLYASHSGQWTGECLAGIARRLRKEQLRAAQGQDRELTLYTAATG